MTKISVLVPAYHEGKNLPKLIDGLERTLQDAFEIIVINDENLDGSVEIIKELEAKYDEVRGIFHNTRKGKTEAIKDGLKHAKGDIVVLMDADLQYLPEEILKLIGGLEYADVVNGRRIDRKDSLRRKIESRIYNSMVRLLFKVKLYDCNCGLKIFKRRVLMDIVPGLKPRWHRYLLVLAEKKGYKVVEKPIGHRKRTAGRSNFSSPLKLLEGFYDLLLVHACIRELNTGSY